MLMLEPLYSHCKTQIAKALLTTLNAQQGFRFYDPADSK